MKNISLLGRILYSIPFAIFGLNHFLMVDFYTGMLTTIIPGGGYTIMFTGALMILIAVLIVAKKFVKEASMALAFLLILFILTIHIPNLLVPESFFVSLVNLLKDTSLLGGTLMIIGSYEKAEKNKS